jgi:Domain of unknown function (DUF4279)
MANADKWYAYFHVRGSFDPDEITRRLGVKPTRVSREGDPIGKTSKKRPCSAWELYSRLDETEPLERHVQDVLDQLDDNRAEFEKLSREFNGTMEVVGYFRECEPGPSLEPEIVDRMAEYWLTLDCDFYCQHP